MCVCVCVCVCACVCVCVCVYAACVLSAHVEGYIRMCPHVEIWSENIASTCGLKSGLAVHVSPCLVKDVIV